MKPGVQRGRACADSGTDSGTRDGRGGALRGARWGGLAFGAAIAMSMAPGIGSAQDIKGDAKAAESKNAMCIGCHGIPGYKASFPQVYSVPMIGGQSAKYIENALVAYRKAERSHPTMQAIAGGLSDQDIADLAAYYSAKK